MAVKHKDVVTRWVYCERFFSAWVPYIYHQDSLLYTALGHVITDDNSRLPGMTNNIVRATVTGVHPSKNLVKY